MKIAFFGTGLMGSGFVRRMRANGNDVNVWNRTAEKASVLETEGARAFADPAAALAGAERLHLSLADDASVDAVLEPLAERIAPATWIVDHTTTAVTPTAERVKRWNARGRTLVHARCSWRRQTLSRAQGSCWFRGRARATMRSCPSCRR